MATPHVSAVAALVWSHFPECTPSAIRHALSVSAEDLGDAGRDVSFGFGLVQAKAAFDQLAANGCVEPPPPPPPPPPPVVEELFKDVVRGGISGDSGSEVPFMVKVPEGAENLVITMSGGSGDGDLYVRFGEQPTTSLWDCRPFIGGNFEQCFFSVPNPGTYYLMVRGFSSYSNTSLVATWERGSCGSESLFGADLPLSIPDNSATGASSVVNSQLAGNVLQARVRASIDHTARGDLVVTLLAPTGESFVLAKRTGGAADDLLIDTDLPAAVGLAAGGEWKLLVQDRALRDRGTLTEFELGLEQACE
jgi:serine protease